MKVKVVIAIDIFALCNQNLVGSMIGFTGKCIFWCIPYLFERE
jgi:hypothetical protein